MSFNELLKSLVFADAGIDAEIEFDDQGAGKIKAKTTVSAPRVFSGTADEFSQLPPEQQDKFNKMQEHIDNFNIRNRNIPGEEGEFERLQDETMPAFAQIKTELTPPADPANAAGAASGALTATLGTPGDVVGLASGAIYGIYKLAFPNEDETRLQSAARGFANVLGTVSETAGSMYTRSVFDGWLDKMPLDEETKAKIGEGADLGEWFGVPGAGTAVALGKKGVMKGAQKLGDFVTNAPDRIAAREADTAVQLNAGVDVPAAVDQAIVGVQKTFKKPTKDNPVTAVAPTETEPGIIAFHGSGADFDQFNVEKIGTGEGAQAYGYGLYFTDSEDIAKFYRNAIGGSGYEKIDYSSDTHAAKSIPDIDHKEVDGYKSYRIDQANDVIKSALKMQRFNVEPDENALNIFEMTFERDGALQIDMRDGTSVSLLKNFEGDSFTVTPLKKAEGKTYKVALEPKPEELLDYDKPIGNQSEDIKAKISKLVENEITPDDLENFGMPKGDLKASLLSENRSVISFLNDFAAIRGKDNAGEELLNKYGIKGLKYKAAGSRGAGVADAAAERNYVIFDDKMIKILEKYGIVGPVAITGVAASQQGEAETSEAM